MILMEAYEILKEHKLTLNQYDFSINWLSMAHSYLSSAVARDREPSAVALLTLGGKLTRAADEMRRGYNHRVADILDKLKERVWSELDWHYGSSS